MTMTALPSISSLPSQPTDIRAQVLDTLFEPCTQLHTLSISLLRTTTFPSYSALIAAVGAQLTSLYDSSSTSDTDWLDAILSAHPRLGEKKVEQLSDASKAEQAKLQGGDPGEGEALKVLNQEYEEKFPGLRYVVFVNNRSRPVIMEDMRRRIESSSLAQERRDAIQAMCDIANDRAGKMGGG